jgi:hypothetical protein
MGMGSVSGELPKQWLFVWGEFGRAASSGSQNLPNRFPPTSSASESAGNVSQINARSLKTLSLPNLGSKSAIGRRPFLLRAFLSAAPLAKLIAG